METLPRQTVRTFIRGFFIFEIGDVVFGLLRLLGQGEGDLISSLMLKYVMVSRPIFILFLVYILHRLKPSELGIPFVLAYALPLLGGLVNGALRGNSLYAICADFSILAYGGMVLLIALRIFQLMSLDELFVEIEKALKIWLIPMLVCFVIFVVLYQARVIKYPGFTTGYILLPLFFWTVRKRWFEASIGWTVVLLSGRRGTLMAAVIALMLVYLIKNFGVRNLGKVIFGISLVSGLAMIIISRTNLESLYESDFTTLQKFTAFDPSQYDISSPVGLALYLEVATSGRWNEVVGVYEEMVDDPTVLYFGKGLGATYTVYFSDPAKANYETGQHRNVHFSYLGILLLFGFFGLPYLVLIGLALSRMVFRIHEPLCEALLLTIVAHLILSCTGFNFFQDFYMWLFAGYGLIDFIRSRTSLDASRVGLSSSIGVRAQPA